MHPLDMSDDVLEHLADVPRADVHRLRLLEALAPPRNQHLVAAHRVFELGAVSLDRERQSGGGGDGPAEQDVVREHEIGRRLSTQSGRIQGDVAVALCACAVL